MEVINHFISCDWGTTNLRLKVANLVSNTIEYEHNGGEGVKNLFAEYKSQSVFSQKDFFLNYLQGQINLLSEKWRGLPIVISGMASSTLGILELPYASLPIDFDAKNLFQEQMILPQGNLVILISGVKSNNSMMRGEEIQVLGIAKSLIDLTGILILPGTHSKHIAFEKNQFTTLKSFMTGELFDIICSQSILSNSIEVKEVNDYALQAFKDGLDLASIHTLSESLFFVRAKHILEGSEKSYNYFYLSGIVIGSELVTIKELGKKVFLVSQGTIGMLYRTALFHYLDPDKIETISDRDLELAVIMGQKKILERY